VLKRTGTEQSLAGRNEDAASEPDDEGEAKHTSGTDIPEEP
jgi:hypothetical protein